MNRVYQNWASNPYFDKNEFECPCCKQSLVADNFIHKLTHARFLADVPFIINSGYRCRDHNYAIKGVLSSSHIKGLAADISARNPDIRQKVLYGLILAGFKRIGIYTTFIHVDCDPDKPNCIWL